MSTQSARIRREVPVFVLVLLYLLVLFERTLQLPADARLVPLLIVVPTIIITIARILTILIPGLVPEIFRQDTSLADLEVEDESNSETGAGIAETLSVIAWFGAFAISIYLAGFMASTVLFVTLFLTLFGDQPPLRSVTSAVLLGVVVYTLFMVAINVRPIEPLLFPSLP